MRLLGNGASNPLMLFTNFIGRQFYRFSLLIMDYVFGYAPYNDTTVRQVQQKLHGGQWFKGKSLDGHGPEARGG